MSLLLDEMLAMKNCWWDFSIIILNLCSSTINSSTIPPKTQPSMSVFDLRRASEEVSAGVRVTETVSNNLPKPSRPPPRVPATAAGMVNLSNLDLIIPTTYCGHAL